jgi:hypothetical protein
MCTQFNIFLALPPSVPPRNYDILRTDRHKSKSRQYIDRRERLGRVSSGETIMSRLGVLPSAATKSLGISQQVAPPPLSHRPFAKENMGK